MCLCLGPTGSGKTLLLKKLQNRDAVDTMSSTVPTVGTNLITVRFGNQKETTIREVGGAMAPIWKSYYSGIQKIMYVVDASNLCQIAAAGVLLYTILAEPCLQKAKKIREIIKEDRRPTIEEIVELSGVTWSSVQRILTEDLGMKRVAAKFVRLLTAEQQEGRVEACCALKEESQNDQNFFLFPRMKRDMKGKRFADAEVKEKISEALSSISKDEFRQCFEKWNKRLDKCISILLVLSKMDASYRQMRNEALLMLQLTRLKKEISQDIAVVEASAMTGEGIDNMLKWLQGDSIAPCKSKK
ncbi:hypothetical protein B7P43_G15893 [Cryptotermes secundus]|uniref:ADP-ribosylation factor-like protein 16 n=1 Tax=Cryptotermes secundus TaxID=105785 RepID=A0A2J7R6H6_9NEOP|nr:hypothetical protein B7P43_G15893 [Cryptotermes secundus]